MVDNSETPYIRNKPLFYYFTYIIGTRRSLKTNSVNVASLYHAPCGGWVRGDGAGGRAGGEGRVSPLSSTLDHLLCASQGVNIDKAAYLPSISRRGRVTFLPLPYYRNGLELDNVTSRW